MRFRLALHRELVSPSMLFFLSFPLSRISISLYFPFPASTFYKSSLGLGLGLGSGLV